MPFFPGEKGGQNAAENSHYGGEHKRYFEKTEQKDRTAKAQFTNDQQQRG
jgi:hypothetical protein